MIDKQEIFNKFSQIELTINEDGLIPAYDSLMIRLPSDFFNLYSFNILRGVDGPLYDYAAGLLEHAAAECGYYTALQVIGSKEFKEVADPMIKSPEDKLYGLIEVINAWGWANIEIIELVPAKKLVLRAYDYYEADVRNIEEPQKPFAYMLRGIARAFMDVVYTEKSEECPYSVLSAYKSEQIKAIEMGDEYGEFVVTTIKEIVET